MTDEEEKHTSGKDTGMDLKSTNPTFTSSFIAYFSLRTIAIVCFNNLQFSKRFLAKGQFWKTMKAEMGHFHLSTDSLPGYRATQQTFSQKMNRNTLIKGKSQYCFSSAKRSSTIPEVNTGHIHYATQASFSLTPGSKLNLSRSAFLVFFLSIFSFSCFLSIIPSFYYKASFIFKPIFRIKIDFTRFYLLVSSTFRWLRSQTRVMCHVVTLSIRDQEHTYPLTLE